MATFGLPFGLTNRKLLCPSITNGSAFGRFFITLWNACIVSLLNGTCLVPLFVLGVSM